MFILTAIFLPLRPCCPGWPCHLLSLSYTSNVINYFLVFKGKNGHYPMKPSSNTHLIHASVTHCNRYVLQIPQETLQDFKGIFLDRWKISLIEPLYKKYSKLHMTNYRTISLLTPFSKILEKVTQIRLLHHLTKFNILTKEQFVFTTKLTTENVAYALTN
jgi:hypothetical protein